MNQTLLFTRRTVYLFVLVAATSCTYESPISNGEYPDKIAHIIVNKCATAGCHNTLSKDVTGGYDFTTWNRLFEGGRNGSPVIPYRPDQSFFMNFVNTYADLGPVTAPSMPLYLTPLTREEVITLRDWISSGAPDRNGYVKFSGDPNRKKIYVCNQGCDIVTVFDEQTRLPMRIINVGASPQTEAPHDVVVSPDGQYWYVCFYSGTVFQKFRTSDDVKVGEVDITAGQWSSMTISEDSRYAWIVDWESVGRVALVDLQTMTLLTTYTDATMEWPHGSCVSSDMQTLYLTAQTGNYIFKVDISQLLLPQFQTIVLEPGGIKTFSSLDPHQIDVSPDGTKYFVTCQKSNEVRVFNVANDSLLAVIPTGGDPQELEFSETHPYLFVSCMNDSITTPGRIGSVTVINYQTNSFVKSIYSGWQPHGLNVDDVAGLVYVANRNVNANGPAPHHTSSCGGRNGYMTVIDMNTLDLVPGYKIEVSVDPYEVGVRD